jgi:acetoin utilization protein AcuB
MTRNPVYIAPDASVTDARVLMSKEKIGKLPVLDRDNKLVGIITKNDLIKVGPSSATSLDMYEIGYLLSKLRVEKVMTKKVIVTNPDEVMEEAARIMVDENIGCLPVLDDELLVGIVTESDLFRVFINIFGARHSGLRATFFLDEKPGQLAKVTQRIAELGGNIVSTVTADADIPSRRRITVKVTILTIEQMREILKEVDAEEEDLRII